MIYLFIGLTIVVYFLLVFLIFHGIQDQKTVSFVSKVKNIVKAKKYETIHSNIK